MTPLTALILPGLLLATALYVAAEFAAVSVRHTRLQQMAEEGSATARWMFNIVSDPRALDRYVAACQIGITLTSLVLGAFGAARLTPVLAPRIAALIGADDGAEGPAALVVLLSLSAASMILSELVPKSLALQSPTRAALLAALPMRWSLILFRPFIFILNGCATILLRAFGAQHHAQPHVHSAQELVLLIAESRDGGLLEEDEQQRLERALQLSVRPVRRLIVPRTDIVAVDVEAPMEAAVRRIIESGFTRLPVYRRSLDDMVGTVHVKDLGHYYVRHGWPDSLEQIMRPIAMVPENMRAERLVAELRAQASDQAIVVDEHGGVAGLVTLEDLLADVLGESEANGSGAEHLPDGRIRLPGRMQIDEAREWLGVLWEGEADTVGGRVVEELGHLPAVGERVTIDGVDVEIEAIDGFTIASLLATPVAADAEEDD